MTSTVKNIKVGNTSYPVQDTKATPFLSSTDEATLLSDGTYRGETVANGTIFTKPDGTLNEFSATLIDPTWLQRSSAWNFGSNFSQGENRTKIATDGTYTLYACGYNSAAYSYYDVANTRRLVTTSSGPYAPSGAACVYLSSNNTFYYFGRSANYIWTPGTTTFTAISDATHVCGDDPRLATNGTIIVHNGYYSYDAQTWNQCNITTLRPTYDKVTGKFIDVLNNGYCYESSDGITWTYKGNTGVSQYINYLAAYNGIIVGFRRNGTSNTRLYTSTDGGATWTNSVYDDVDYRVDVCNGLFYIYRQDGTYTFLVSTDGINWSSIGKPVNYADPLVSIDNEIQMVNQVYYLPTTQQYDYALTPTSHTVEEVNTALETKQDTLTAGTGITIAGTAALSPSITVVGTPTMTADGIASGFSDSDYYSVDNMLRSATRSFEIVTAVNMTTAADNNLGIIDSTQQSSTRVGLRLTTSATNTVRLRVSTEGGATYPVDITGTTPLTVGTKIWIKATYNSSTGYALYTSTDGSTWTTEGTSTLTTAPFNNEGFYIGDNSATGLSLTGSIYMLDTYTKVDDVINWRAAKVVNPVISSTGGGGGSSYTAGDGISISNNVISLTTPYEVVQTLPASPTTGKIYFVTGS